jgi:hypothetical protein
MAEASDDAGIRSLGRSLEPLAGEALDGYLLRLAHRLRLAPLHLAQATGCTTGSSTQVSRRLLLGFGNRDDFARATRLSQDEAQALTLSSWRDRYPPIHRFDPSRAGQRGYKPDARLFNNVPRYCPNCLAGDGSPIQQLHGGPWMKTWHLPIVFSCLEHRRFLHSGCPQGHLPDPASWLLVTQPAESTLHPAQCRCRTPTPGSVSTSRRSRPICGTRLDTAHNIETARPAADLLEAQQRVLAVLDSPNAAPEARRFFTDLRLMTALLCASWPLGRQLMAPAVIEPVAEHVRWLRRQSSGGSRLNYPMDKPPTDPVAGGALLSAATTLLETTDLQDVLTEHLDASRSVSRARTPWAGVFTRHENSCSDPMRLAAHAVLHPFRRVSLRGRIAPSHVGGYRPEHIPAFLEEGWYDKNLAPLGCETGMKAMRRTAATRIVQWAAGGPYDEAADFLGINTSGNRYKLTVGFTQWLATGDASKRFTAALQNLVCDLDAAPRLVDYRRRRDALRNWSLDGGAWNEIVAGLPPSPRNARPDLGARKRHAASAFVWARVTQGEPEFAPWPTDAEHPTDRQSRDRSRGTIWSRLSRQNPYPHYAALRDLLNDYADQIAKKIDSGAEIAR